MFSSRSALPLALIAAQLCASIPVAPQQAIIALKGSGDNVKTLIHDVTASDLANAQIDYANVQANLDDMGFYLGQLTDSTCIADGPTNSNSAAATSQAAALTALNSITTSLHSMSGSISHKNNAAAISAYHHAQSTLESTYDFIFNVATPAPITTGDSATNSSSSQSVFTSIQSAQVALNALSFDLVRSDYTSAKQDYQKISSQLNDQIAPAAQCTFSAGNDNDATCTSALTCIQSLQLALNEVEGDVLASASTAADCQTAGAAWAATYKYISQA